MVTSRIGPHHRLFATAEAVTALGLAKGVLVAFYAHLIDFVLFLFIIIYHHCCFWLFQDGTRSSPKTWTTDFSCYWLLGGWTEWIRASNSLHMLSISGFLQVEISCSNFWEWRVRFRCEQVWHFPPSCRSWQMVIHCWFSRGLVVDSWRRCIYQRLRRPSGCATV